MIRNIPGFAPQDDSKPAEQAASPTLPSVDQAKAFAAQRQTEVLNYTRRASAESPLIQNLRTDGPTLEVWIKSGYKPENYPPQGYAEKPSPGLDEWKALQAAVALSTATVESLSTAQVASLTTAQVSSLATVEIQALTPHAVNEHPEV